MTIRYTSNNVNKWGVMNQGKTVEYEYKKNHNGFCLLVLLVPTILVLAYIFSMVK